MIEIFSNRVQAPVITGAFWSWQQMSKANEAWRILRRITGRYAPGNIFHEFDKTVEPRKLLLEASLRNVNDKEDFCAAPVPWTCYDDSGIWIASWIDRNNNLGIAELEGDTVKKHFLVAAILAMLASFSVSASAQGPRKGQAMDRSALIPECSTFERLDLSAAQREALKRIDESYKEQILQHRNSLMLKRIELRGLLRDPDAHQQVIQGKAKEMGDVREALQQKMIDYQIQIREILTPEQIRRWCTMMGEPQGGWKGDSWCR